MINHVWLEKRATASNGLMTPEDEQNKIRELLGPHFLHTGKLFKPDDEFFQLASDAELQASAKRLFVWLGTKPGHMEIKYGQLPQPGIYMEDPGMKRLIINEKLRFYPLQCAAVLTHLVMHAVIAGKKRFVLEDPVENELFVNQAIIHGGLALAVINGLAPTHFWQKFQLAESIGPKEYFPDLRQFIWELARFISAYRLHHEEYAHHLAPWIEKYLPPELTIRLTVRNSQPAYIQKSVEDRKKVILKSAVAVLALLILVGAAFYALSRKPDTLTAEQQKQLQAIQSLRADYDGCIKSMQEKRRNLDHNDIFQQQIIDGDMARCSSLRSQYNTLVTQYNQSLNKK